MNPSRRHEAVEELFGGPIRGLLTGVVLRPEEELSDRELRQRAVADAARDFVAEAVGEALSDLAASGMGFDFEDEVDRTEFLQAVQAGGIWAVIEQGDEDDNADFFEVLLDVQRESHI